jgi:hypothetical protein
MMLYDNETAYCWNHLAIIVKNEKKQLLDECFGTDAWEALFQMTDPRVVVKMLKHEGWSIQKIRSVLRMAEHYEEGDYLPFLPNCLRA